MPVTPLSRDKKKTMRRILWIGAALAAVFVLGAVGPSFAQQPATAGGQPLKQACKADYDNLCKGVQPGGGRILACLQQNIAKVSPGCQQALTTAKAARQSPPSGQ